jgi:hypothetical protein
LWIQCATNIWNYGYHEKDDLEAWVLPANKATGLILGRSWDKYYEELKPGHQGDGRLPSAPLATREWVGNFDRRTSFSRP